MPELRVLFNSYYNSIGEQYPRPRRGLLTRPSLAQVHEYRAHVDALLLTVIEQRGGDPADPLCKLIEAGGHHEQQHQELILMDIKHLFAQSPLFPALRLCPESPRTAAAPLDWVAYPGGLCEIGHEGAGFHFDNEAPRHRVHLEPFELASRLVTNGEYLEFIADRGYERPELWLADGWDRMRADGWSAPLYWRSKDGERRQVTLSGLRELRADEPVCHLSFYEAEAYARWAGARLPVEAEWEQASKDLPIDGNFVESDHLHPVPAADAGSGRAPAQMFGDVWEWTASSYLPYPGYRPPAGPMGEYNGKFMCNQIVLRGGSCVTSQSHVRRTYRNFFYPHQRWQFGGLRLARWAG